VLQLEQWNPMVKLEEQQLEDARLEVYEDEERQ